MSMDIPLVTLCIGLSVCQMRRIATDTTGAWTDYRLSSNLSSKATFYKVSQHGTIMKRTQGTTVYRVARIHAIVTGHCSKETATWTVWDE
jgi:hypothetical protein